jgi:hypothetical protein
MKFILEFIIFVEIESPKFINLLIDKHVLKWLNNLRWTWPSVCVCVCFFWNEFFDVAKEGDHPSIGSFIKGENHPYDDELGQIWLFNQIRNT